MGRICVVIRPDQSRGKELMCYIQNNTKILCFLRIDKLFPFLYVVYTGGQKKDRCRPATPGRVMVKGLKVLIHSPCGKPFVFVEGRFFKGCRA